MNRDHLSDWQIDDLLIGPLETPNGIPARYGLGSGARDQARLHLQDCQLCRSKKERLEETLLLYREAAFIQTNDAASSSNRVLAARETHSFFAHPLFWGWRVRALGFLLLLLILIPAFVMRERGRREAQQIARTHVLEEQATQAKDDLLLQQVDQEITESVPQPMQSLTQPVLDDGSKYE